MKVLECNRCHKLFKSSEIHMAVFTDETYNYCEECTFIFVMLAGKTLNDLELEVDKEGGL